jgi:predicted lipid-binding transport protein (Tim44 family)
MTEAAFLKLQESWQSSEYTPMKPLLMPDLYADHLSQIQGMVRDHEIDVLDGLKIDRIDLVNVRYTLKEEQREFTALITATARDYYIDDRTKVQTRGDKEPAQFQEFWTFQYMNKTWLVREIEQTRESDALKEENFFEQVTDKGIEQIYGEPVSSTGPAGPWLEKSVGVKETRIERMLNFLVKTDRIWDRKTMLLTARRLFLEMTAAWESGDPASVPTGECFPEIAEDLRAHLAKNRDAGITLEFRNLCVRKVELVLVKNFDDNSKDEFVARIRAHAQKCIRRKGALVRQDDDVTPFEQHLTFGRLDSRWKLKEVLNANEAQGLVSQENVDQESSPQQLRWYYQHKRAL